MTIFASNIKIFLINSLIMVALFLGSIPWLTIYLSALEWTRDAYIQTQQQATHECRSELERMRSTPFEKITPETKIRISSCINLPPFELFKELKEFMG